MASISRQVDQKGAPCLDQWLSKAAAWQTSHTQHSLHGKPWSLSRHCQARCPVPPGRWGHGMVHSGRGAALSPGARHHSLELSAEIGPQPQATDGIQQGRQAAAERLLGARTDCSGRNPAICSYRSHLTNLATTNPVTTRVCGKATASLPSSRSLVRIQQGAFPVGRGFGRDFSQASGAPRWGWPSRRHGIARSWTLKRRRVVCVMDAECAAISIG
jgi:hypothetical protein